MVSFEEMSQLIVVKNIVYRTTKSEAWTSKNYNQTNSFYDIYKAMIFNAFCENVKNKKACTLTHWKI